MVEREVKGPHGHELIRVGVDEMRRCSPAQRDLGRGGTLTTFMSAPVSQPSFRPRAATSPITSRSAARCASVGQKNTRSPSVREGCGGCGREGLAILFGLIGRPARSLSRTPRRSPAGSGFLLFRVIGDRAPPCLRTAALVWLCAAI